MNKHEVIAGEYYYTTEGRDGSDQFIVQAEKKFIHIIEDGLPRKKGNISGCYSFHAGVKTIRLATPREIQRLVESIAADRMLLEEEVSFEGITNKYEIF